MIPIKTNTKLGFMWAEVGDSIALDRPNSTTKRGVVTKKVAHTLDTACNQGVVVTSGLKMQGDDYTERIRKLTPKECWRLQGFSEIKVTEQGIEFDDTLFERAEKVLSNSRLYKCAGNSITVDVLCHLMKHLFDGI